MIIEKLKDKYFPECNEERLEIYNYRKKLYDDRIKFNNNVKIEFPINIYYDDAIRIINE